MVRDIIVIGYLLILGNFYGLMSDICVCWSGECFGGINIVIEERECVDFRRKYRI